MFDPQFSTYTPLDFRSVAAAQFRLLAASCAKQINQAKGIQDYVLAKRIVTTKTLLEESLSNQLNPFIEKLSMTMEYSYSGSAPHDYLSGIIKLGGFISVVHTNAFQIIKPNSSTIISNFYPLYDNASFQQVMNF